MKKKYQPLMIKLGYQFNSIDLLRRALTHRSYKKENNERLEFLGDGILNFVIAEYLFSQFAQLNEGDLSRLRASLVKGETLAKLARQFELNHYICLGIGELKSGGAERDSILADALEAIIGAIYLDSDFAYCRSRVLSWYHPMLEQLDINNTDKDPKTQLQEFLQSKKYSLPQYKIIRVEGEAHDQTFYVLCFVENLQTEAIGYGKSRRKAEQMAAQILMKQLIDSPSKNNF